MDDGHLIHSSKACLQDCLKSIKAVCAELEITLNSKKTQIVKLSHGFTYLKIQYYILPSGRIVKKVNRGSVTKTRHKFIAFRRRVDEGVMTYADVYQSFQSRRAYLSNFNAYRTIQSMDAMYMDLFIAR